MGLETPSVGPQIAECQRVLEKSGLEYKVSSPFTPLDYWVLTLGFLEEKLTSVDAVCQSPLILQGTELRR
jgi:hypothetical protein